MTAAKSLPLSLVLFLGCNTVPGIPLGGLDGDWQITLTGGQGIAGSFCITVTGSTIVRFDDGCFGINLPILSASPAVISGDRIIWNVAVTQLFQGQSIIQQFTIDVLVQPDGSLVGTETSVLPELGPASEVTLDVIMNRV